jgi:hypothetical protein
MVQCCAVAGCSITEMLLNVRSFQLRKVYISTKMRVFSAVAILIIPWIGAAAAPAPDTLWTSTYGDKWYNDLGYCVQESSTGGCVLAGYTKSYGAGDTDFLLVGTDANGDTLWLRTYGGPYRDEAHSVQRTSDHGYIAVGNTLSFGAGSWDIYAVRTDANGDSLWTRTFGGPGWDEAWCVERTLDDGFVIAGFTDSYGAGSYDAYLVRIDANGDTLWTRTYGGTGYDGAKSVEATSDGGFIITGATASFGAAGYDIYIVRTDAGGDTLWTRRYGGGGADRSYSIQQTADSGYIVSGYTGSYDPDRAAAFLMRMNAEGDTLWTRTYGGSDEEIAYSVQQTPDGGFVFTGYTMSFGSGGKDLYIVRTDPAGDTLWTRVYGHGGDDLGYSILRTPDGGYLIGGGTYPSGVYYFDAWLVRMAPDCAGTRPIPPNEDTSVTLWGGPNPFSERLLIGYGLDRLLEVRLVVYDVLGQEVRSLACSAQQPGRYTLIWDGKNNFGEDVRCGLYTLRLEAEGQSTARKILLLK